MSDLNSVDDMRNFTITSPSFAIVPATADAPRHLSCRMTVDGTEYAATITTERGKFTGEDMWCACKALIRALERHGRPDV